MTKYSKYNVIYRLQKWMDSVPGQTFLNYAYSWGASIVILGALFKLTHLPGANFMLFLGMGTEVFVFFLSAFDRPFDKTAEGRELPTHVEDNDEAHPSTEDEHPAVDRNVQPQVAPVQVQGAIPGGTIIVNGTAPSASQEGHPATVNVPFAASESISPEMTEATNRYVEELKKLTETLEKVSAQSERLTTDSEEMENLNRTLTGICKVYEMQLKSASSQIGTIDQINEQTRKMAAQIEQLNKIYTRMIEAMTINMKAAAPGANL